MQIACNRFGCQKAVEVCYWACKFRRNCKDWQGAIEGDPGSEAIRERLEGAAAKSGRLFDQATLVKPARPKRLTVPRLVSPSVLPASNGAQTARAESANQSKPIKRSKPKEATKKMTKKNDEAVTSASPQSPANEPRKTNTPRKRAQRPKPAANGEVYLLLEKNGKYKEVREKDLLSEAAKMLKDPSIRLIKGRLLVPQISLRPAGE